MRIRRKRPQALYCLLVLLLWSAASAAAQTTGGASSGSAPGTGTAPATGSAPDAVPAAGDKAADTKAAPRRMAAHSGLFLDVAAQYHLLFGSHEYSYPFNNGDKLLGIGFRGTVGLGLQLGPGVLALGLRSGVSFAEVDNDEGPVDVTVIPIGLMLGYDFPLAHGFSLRGSAVSGFYCVLSDKEVGFELFLGPRLYAELSPGKLPLAFYLGGGADFVPESAGLIILPEVELGLRFWPPLK